MTTHSTDTTASDPLRGVRVLDFGSFITAPYAAMLLAEFGADVVKVERPAGGDPFRAFGGGLYSAQFQAHNRHKRSLAFDYRHPAARPTLDLLLSRADVVIVNSRPGAARAMGLDFESVAKFNPRAVVCSITGFGETGPWAARPAFDNVGQAISGWMSRFRTGDDARVVGPAVSDAATGMHAALAILAALHGVRSTGVGCAVDVNMLESTMALAVEPLGQYLATRSDVPVYQRAAMSQSYTVTCADGQRIGLHLSSPDKFWQGLCRAVDKPSWLAEFPTRMHRVRGYDLLAARFADVFATAPRAHWEAALLKEDVPFAPERTLGELLDDPQVRHLQSFHELQHPRQGTVTAQHRPARIGGQRLAMPLPPPELGEHSDAVLRELGVADDELLRLRSLGVLGASPASAGEG